MPGDGSAGTVTTPLSACARRGWPLGVARDRPHAGLAYRGRLKIADPLSHGSKVDEWLLTRADRKNRILWPVLIGEWLLLAAVGMGVALVRRRRQRPALETKNAKPVLEDLESERAR